MKMIGSALPITRRNLDESLKCNPHEASVLDLSRVLVSKSPPSKHRELQGLVPPHMSLQKRRVSFPSAAAPVRLVTEIIKALGG